MKWRDIWETEAKLVDDDGRELARIQKIGVGWVPFVDQKQIGAEGYWDKNGARARVELNVGVTA